VSEVLAWTAAALSRGGRVREDAAQNAAPHAPRRRLVRFSPQTPNLFRSRRGISLCAGTAGICSRKQEY
jgi:hypothetical protein